MFYFPEKFSFAVSVSTLIISENQYRLVTTPQCKFYQRIYVQRVSPTKSTSPTHEAKAKSQARSRKLSYRNTTLKEPLKNCQTLGKSYKIWQSDVNGLVLKK